MRIIDINKDNVMILFKYWKELGKSIPYFYETTYEAFVSSIFFDKFNNLETLKVNFVKAALDGDRVVGFIQYGIPSFHYTETGELLNDPDIGVIRNLYFDREQSDMGNKLIDTALEYFKINDYDNLYAFYHAMGMSCNGNHGKLHEDFSYIAKLLFAKDFQIEHENVYYTIDMKEKNLNQKFSFTMKVFDQADGLQRLDLMDGEETLGNAQIKYLNNYTGITDEDKVYLVWIGIKQTRKRMGIGSNFIEQIMNYCLAKGYRYMHTDTALNNIDAQKFYERNEFINHGITRSYLKNSTFFRNKK